MTNTTTQDATAPAADALAPSLAPSAPVEAAPAPEAAPPVDAGITVSLTLVPSTLAVLRQRGFLADGPATPRAAGMAVAAIIEKMWRDGVYADTVVLESAPAQPKDPAAAAQAAWAARMAGMNALTDTP